MNKPIADFTGARLKLIWADHHISQVVRGWNAYIERDFAKLIVEDEPNGSDQTVKLVADFLDAEIILAIGDAVHSMRSVLDHMIYAIFGGDSKTTFPFSGERQELVSAFSTDATGECASCGRGSRKGRYAAIEERFPGIASLFIDEIRPYKGGNDLLWAINKLDIRDKHRLIIPAVHASEVSGIDVSNEQGSRFTDGMFGLTGSGTLNGLRMPGPIKIEKYNKPTAEILFDEAGIIEGQRVIPTLVQMFQIIAQTLERFRVFLTDSGWEVVERINMEKAFPIS